MKKKERSRQSVIMKHAEHGALMPILNLKRNQCRHEVKLNITDGSNIPYLLAYLQNMHPFQLSSNRNFVRIEPLIA